MSESCGRSNFRDVNCAQRYSRDCSQRCYHTEIIRTTIHPKRILSTEKTSEKVVSKKENDTSSNNDNVGKGKWYTTDKTENNLTGFVAKLSVKSEEWNKFAEYYNKEASRRGFSKKMGTQDKIRKKEQYNELLDKLKRSGHFGERLKEIGVLGNLGEYFPEVSELRVCQFALYSKSRTWS